MPGDLRTAMKGDMMDAPDDMPDEGGAGEPASLSLPEADYPDVADMDEGSEIVCTVTGTKSSKPGEPITIDVTDVQLVHTKPTEEVPNGSAA